MLPLLHLVIITLGISLTPAISLLIPSPPSKRTTSSTGTSQYYLLTSVVSGDVTKNGSYVVPVQITHSNTTNTTTTPQNYAAVLPPSSPQTTFLLTPGFLAHFYQEFTDPANNTTMAFTLPAVDIVDLGAMGEVFISGEVEGAELGEEGGIERVWNAGFEFDVEGDGGLVFVYAGEKVMRGWVVCDGKDYPQLYWTWSPTPSIEDSEMDNCALVDLVPEYL